MPYSSIGDEIVVSQIALPESEPEDDVGVVVGSKVARSVCSPSEELSKQLKSACLWRYNYEEWYDALAGVKLRNSDNEIYSPVIDGVRFVPLSSMLLRNIDIPTRIM